MHTQQYTFCLFVCLSLCEPARLLVHGPIHPPVIVTTVSLHRLLHPPPASPPPFFLFSILPALHTTYPLSLCQLMHTGLHCSEVGACHGSKHSTESTDMHVRASQAERDGEEGVSEGKEEEGGRVSGWLSMGRGARE